ncbi:MAG: hypothetical protein EPN91_11005 [Salinibacterium sp.]|nr:MAG: hypothetical protein EPN91_11005 [Salinibacterium sp.]
MTQIIDTPPSPVDQRRNTTLIAVIIGGVLASLAGIGVMVYALALYTSAGTNLSSNQSTGCLLIAVAGFLVSAAGTDLRHNAHRHRRGI